MKTVNLTCIECPIGCEITATLEGGKVVKVEGNGCPRGKLCAENEVVCPKRVLTTTVKSECGKMIPVKSSQPIKKADLFSAMERVNCVTAKLPVKIGDVIIENIYDGVDIIACADVK